MTTSSSEGILSSPRSQRRLLIGSGIVFIAGLVVFLSLVVFRGTGGLNAPLTNQKAQLAVHLQKAPPPAAAWKVARKFLETVVLGKNLDESYDLMGPSMRNGISRKEWDSGSTTVIPYPANNAKTAGFEVIKPSYRTEITATVDLVARLGAKHVRPHLPFWIRLQREGGKRNGRWLVNYWAPDWMPPVPAYQGGVG